MLLISSHSPLTKNIYSQNTLQKLLNTYSQNMFRNLPNTYLQNVFFNLLNTYSQNMFYIFLNTYSQHMYEKSPEYVFTKYVQKSSGKLYYSYGHVQIIRIPMILSKSVITHLYPFFSKEMVLAPVLSTESQVPRRRRAARFRWSILLIDFAELSWAQQKKVTNVHKQNK